MLVGMVWPGGGGGILTGTGPHSPMIPSQNIYRRDVVVALVFVSTTASRLGNPLTRMGEFPGRTPSKPQYPTPQPILCGWYPPPNTVVLNFSECGPRSGCDLAGGGSLILHKLAVKTLPIYIVAWLRT